MPLRILMINDHIHFGGGGDAVFRLEREAYEEVGHEVFTFSQASGLSKAATDCDLIVPVRSGRLPSKVGKFVSARHVAEALRQLISHTRPDVVRVHLVSRYPAAIYPALYGQRVIQTLHGPNLFCATSWGNLRRDGSPCELGIGTKCWSRGCVSFPEMLLYASLDRRVRPAVKRAVHLYHCPSRQIQTVADALGYGPTLHIPLGIDPTFTEAEPAAHDGPPTILYVGALVEPKGVMFLPEALRLVQDRIPNAKLLLCGRGQLVEPLKREFRLRGLSNSVEFKGFVDRDQMVELYRSAHVLVLPSIWSEQFGLVGPEALACGVPCIASNVGGIPEWLHDGKHGFLVPPRDSRALADRLVALLANRDVRLEFGRTGRAYALKVHHPETYKRRLLELTASLAGNTQTVREHHRQP